MTFIDELKYNEQGLIPAIVQDESNNAVLMMAWMDKEAVRRTLETGRATYWSRSRKKYWVKGETSGHTQEVRSMRIDCDADVLLIRVEQTGAACHEGYRSCFFRVVSPDGKTVVSDQTRLIDPETVYGKKS